MARDFNAELVLGANVSRLRSGLNAGSREVQSFTTRTRTMMMGMTAGIKRSLGSIPGQLGLVGGTAGLFALGRNIIKFDEQLIRLGNQGNMTRKALMGLREETFQVALQTGLSRSDIVTGMNQIIERTGNVKFAVATFNDLAIASRATGAEMVDLGGLASQLDEKFNIKPEGLMAALDILTGQGEAGAYTLKNLAGLAPRLFSTAARLNMTGENDLRRIGAFSQIAMAGTGTAEEATTAVERTLSALIEKEKQIKIKIGFDIRDDKGKFKPLDEMLKGVVKAAKGDEAKLQDIFGEMGIRAVSQLSSAFRKTGKFERLDEFVLGSYDGTIARYFETSMQSISAQLGRMVALGEKLGESSMFPSLQKINAAMQTLLANPEKLKQLDARFQSLGKAIGEMVGWLGKAIEHWKVLLGIFAVYKIGKIGLGMAGLLKGKGGLGGAMGGALGKYGGATPVWVVNGMAGMGSASGGSFQEFTKLEDAAKTKMGMGNLIQTMGNIALIGVAVVAAAKVIQNEARLMKQEKADRNFAGQAGFSRVLDTGRKTSASAMPSVSLRNNIRMDLKFDKEGKMYGAAVRDLPDDSIVHSETFIEDYFQHPEAR
jgi:TP901 family phage tail tape measure protein